MAAGLLHAIAALDPGPGVETISRSWRAYRILELRYLEDHPVADVMEHLALGKTQYHREHHRALQAVASVLWERWQAATRWRCPEPATVPSPGQEQDVVRQEADRLLSGKGRSQVDLTAVTREVALLLQSLSAQRGVELRLALPDGTATIRGDRVVLRHALLAILHHAINLAAGGVLEVGLRRGAGEVHLQVSGTASGPLEPAQLGIPESGSFVKALQGRLTFQPAMGPGEWRVDLGFPAVAGRAILVVDNNDDFIRLVQRYLSGSDWEVLSAVDVEHAFALAEGRGPRAILLDIMLPERDGWDLLLTLKACATTRDIPVIVCSVLKEPDVALSLGAAGCLEMPIVQRQLLDLLQAYA